MCTVTFISANDQYYITSNRDEKTLRKTGIPPQKYQVNHVEWLFPKDADAGGTWIAMNENGDMAVLLNGAFEKHISESSYKKSRGLVFTEIISSSEPLRYFQEIDLAKIEPFTIILFSEDQLSESRWDGIHKFSRFLDNKKSYIWSSVTLYEKEVIEKREKWFSKWLTSNPNPSQQEIFNFHRFGGEGDAENDFCMKRKNDFLTVSITTMERNAHIGEMIYCDLRSNKKFNTEYLFSSMAPKS